MEPRDAAKPLVHGQARPYERHLFVCTMGPECQLDGPAEALRSRMKAIVKARGMQDVVRVNHSGCLGMCGHGPMVVSYPDGVWYSHVQEADADSIIDAVLADGPPVERLRFKLGPGGQKALRSDRGRSSCDGEACRR